jgi:hypothetical protein
MVRPQGKVRDECWACSKPIYDSEPTVHQFGLLLHTSCFREENVSPDAERPVYDGQIDEEPRGA